MAEYEAAVDAWRKEQGMPTLAETRRYAGGLKGGALRRGDWDEYVWLHDRPDRVHAFLRVANRDIGDAEYWRLLGEIWTDAEGPGHQDALWRALLAADRAGREGLMSEDDRAMYDSLPDIVTVYRGFDRDGGEGGLSWTLDRSRAEWFARRFAFDGPPKLATTQVPKEDVIAYFGGRSEAEVLVLELPAEIEVEDVPNRAVEKSRPGP